MPSTKTPPQKEKKPHSALNQLLSTAVFTGFCVALLQFLKTAKEMPESQRSLIYFGVTMAMLVILAQYTVNTMRIVHKKTQEDLANADADLIKAKMRLSQAKTELAELERRNLLQEEQVYRSHINVQQSPEQQVVLNQEVRFDEE